MVNKYVTSLKVMSAVDSTNFWLILKKLRQFSYLCGAFFAFKAILICKNKEEAFSKIELLIQKIRSHIFFVADLYNIAFLSQILLDEGFSRGTFSTFLRENQNNLY